MEDDSKDWKHGEILLEFFLKRWIVADGRRMMPKVRRVASTGSCYKVEAKNKADGAR
jgi:hypothetical protein